MCFRSTEELCFLSQNQGSLHLAIPTILWSWNDLMWPLIVNTDVTKMTLASSLPYLQGEYVTNYPILMSGALLAICAKA